jgi:hypothetical protein
LALIDMIQQQLDDNTVSQLSQQLGADPNATRQAVPAALNALLGGLSQNTQQPGGVQQLAGALGAHDGSLLDNLGGILGGNAPAAVQNDGGGILSHIFGGHRPAVESRVGQSTGLNAGQAGKLLMLLAPIVLAYLSRQHRQQQQTAPGASGGGSITDILNGERQRVEQQHPQHGGILGGILDRNHDGSVLDDVVGMAGGLLGGGRR